MPKTNKERAAAYRDRQRQGIAIPTCQCNRPLKGRLAQLRKICTSCHKTTPDGRHQNWVITNKRRDRAVLLEMLDCWGDWKKGDQAIAPDGSKGIVQAITSWIDGTITATVQFEEETQDNFIISLPNPSINH